jgi:hypothetical protein
LEKYDIENVLLYLWTTTGYKDEILLLFIGRVSCGCVLCCEQVRKTNKTCVSQMISGWLRNEHYLP